MALTLDQQKAWWDTAAGRNAKKAILSGREDWSESEFFATGVENWTSDKTVAAAHGVVLGGATALDFGCGIGRMAHALAADYQRVVGVDISTAMLKQAVPRPGVAFLHVFGYPLPFGARSFDLVHSLYVVQHIPMPHSLEYAREFFRLSARHVLFDAPIGESGRFMGEGMFTMDLAQLLREAAKAGFRVAASVPLQREPYEITRFLFARQPEPLKSV